MMGCSAAASVPAAALSFGVIFLVCFAARWMSCVEDLNGGDAATLAGRFFSCRSRPLFFFLSLFLNDLLLSHLVPLGPHLASKRARIKIVEHLEEVGGVVGVAFPTRTRPDALSVAGRAA